MASHTRHSVYLPGAAGQASQVNRWVGAGLSRLSIRRRRRRRQLGEDSPRSLAQEPQNNTQTTGKRKKKKFGTRLPFSWLMVATAAAGSFTLTVVCAEGYINSTQDRHRRHSRRCAWLSVATKRKIKERKKVIIVCVTARSHELLSIGLSISFLFPSRNSDGHLPKDTGDRQTKIENGPKTRDI